jgi:hypothetical protein
LLSPAPDQSEPMEVSNRNDMKLPYPITIRRSSI